MAQQIPLTHVSAEARIAQEVFKAFLIRANLEEERVNLEEFEAALTDEGMRHCKRTARVGKDFGKGDKEIVEPVGYAKKVRPKDVLVLALDPELVQEIMDIDDEYVNEEDKLWMLIDIIKNHVYPKTTATTKYNQQRHIHNQKTFDLFSKAIKKAQKEAVEQNYNKDDFKMIVDVFYKRNQKNKVILKHEIDKAINVNNINFNHITIKENREEV